MWERNQRELSFTFFSNRGSKWHQKTKAGQASEQTKRNMTAIKSWKSLPWDVIVTGKTHRRKILDGI